MISFEQFLSESQSDELLELLKYVYENPKTSTKPSKLIAQFGEELVKLAHDNAYLVGSPGYDQPFLLTIKGKELLGMNKIPSKLIYRTKRQQDWFTAFVDITNKTFKPIGAVKEISIGGGRFLAQVELPMSRLWETLAHGAFASIADAKTGEMLPKTREEIS